MSGSFESDLRAAQAGDREAAGRLVEQNAGLIWSVARRYFGRGADAKGGEIRGDGLPPLCAIGLLETRDDDTCLMRWIYKIRLNEGNVSAKTREDGTIEYRDPTMDGNASKLAYVWKDAENKSYALVEYAADTSDEACTWTPETFFAKVVGPWTTP